MVEIWLGMDQEDNGMCGMLNICEMRPCPVGDVLGAALSDDAWLPCRKL